MKLLLISAIIIFNLISASIPDINDSKWNNVQNNNIRIDFNTDYYYKVNGVEIIYQR